MSSDYSYKTEELHKNPLSRLCVLAYKAINGAKRWDTAAKLFRVLQRLEGGQMHTLTCRELLQADHNIMVGSYAYGPFFRPGIFPPNVRIGRYSSIGPEVRVFNQNHPLDHLSTHPFFYERRWGFVGDQMPRHTLEIGPDVWIGYNAVITPSCKKIGIGAVVGAGAIVTKNVPDFAIVAGTPARVVRMRFTDEICQAVHNSKWWQLSVNELSQYTTLFKECLNDPAQLHPLLAHACS